MSTFTFSTPAQANYYDFRGGSAPAGIGSRFVVATSGGDINNGYGDGIIFASCEFRCSGYSGNYDLYGNIWNSSGNSIANTGAVAGGVDTNSPFGAKTFNFSDKYLPNGTYYAGFSRKSGDWMAWDSNDNNPQVTRYTSSFGTSPDGLDTSYGKTLIGEMTYTIYNAGNLAWSASQVADKTARVTWTGSVGSHGKYISIDWGDGSADTVYGVAANTTPSYANHVYATAGARTITARIYYATASVGIPDITIAHSFTTATVPGAPASVVVTPGAYLVTVNYTAPASNGGATITKYEYSLTGATYYQTSANPFTVAAAAGEQVNVWIRAVNVWGYGNTNFDSDYAYGVPGAPASLTVTPGVGKVTVAYTAPVDNGGESVDSYQYSIDAQQSWTTAPASPFDINGPNGVGIGVYVRAVNAAGGGTAAYAYGGPYTVPDAPTITSPTTNAVSEWAEQIQAFWTANGNGGSAITRYEYSFDGTNYTSLGLVTSAYFSSLSRRTLYNLRIRAVNAAGAGAAASVSSYTGGGRIWVYDGAGWTKKFVMTGTGAMATIAPVKQWNGSSWVFTNV